MLYLIRTFGRGTKTAVKVGYTSSKGRFTSYLVHNPFYELLSSREGGEKEEMKLHLYLKALGYKEKFLNEWFFDVPEVSQRFHDRINKINQVLWKNRESLFLESDFKTGGNKTRKEIYEELKELYSREFNPAENSIDSAWLREENLSILKAAKNEYKQAMRRIL